MMPRSPTGARAATPSGASGNAALPAVRGNAFPHLIHDLRGDFADLPHAARLGEGQG